MVGRLHRRLRVIVAIVEVPLEGETIEHSMLYEQLACGHRGIALGPTYRGWEGPLKQRPEQFAHLVGRMRQCQTCTTKGDL